MLNTFSTCTESFIHKRMKSIVKPLYNEDALEDQGPRLCAQVEVYPNDVMHNDGMHNDVIHNDVMHNDVMHNNM